MSSRKSLKTFGILARFSATGLFNTGFGYAIIFGLMALGLNAYASNFCGYGAGLIVSFLLHRNWVFRSKQQMTATGTKYVVAVGLAYSANFSILHLFINAGGSPWLAQIAAGVLYTAALFLLTSKWVFKDRPS